MWCKWARRCDRLGVIVAGIIEQKVELACVVVFTQQGEELNQSGLSNVVGGEEDDTLVLAGCISA